MFCIHYGFIGCFCSISILCWNSYDYVNIVHSWTMQYTMMAFSSLCNMCLLWSEYFFICAFCSFSRCPSSNQPQSLQQNHKTPVNIDKCNIDKNIYHVPSVQLNALSRSLSPSAPIWLLSPVAQLSFQDFSPPLSSPFLGLLPVLEQGVSWTPCLISAWFSPLSW